MTVRVAFVGAGQMARNHWRALGRVSIPAVVVGVYDRVAAQREDMAALVGAPAFASLDALFDEARPDVVHVCTPPAAHFEAASAALDAGAHVYVEKPFARTRNEAVRLLDLARARGRIVCAGHQLLRDPAFESLLAQAPALGELVQVDSHFAFRPGGGWMSHAGAGALAQQLVDILPHPLYALVAVLDRFGPAGAPVEIDWMRGGATDLYAVLRAGEIVGRLSVSLRARPIASSITVTGTRGSLTADLVRSIVVGAGNSGTEALEKVLNPIVEGTQLITRTARSVGRRVRTGVSYPGLSELIDAFYTAIVHRIDSPVSPDHLMRVSDLFEHLVAAIDAATTKPCHPVVTPAKAAPPRVAVTGARGFLGAEIARALAPVRGIGRVPNGADPHVSDWVATDLSRGVSAATFAGIDVVVHAAAETAGDFAAHQRNTIDATGRLLRAMHEAGVRRLVLVSSLSVLRPPRTPWERQDERTPRPARPDRFGAYAWGKTQQEALVERDAPRFGIAVRIVRPGALIDWHEPALPGLLGRHLFGPWHLGLGRPRLPIAVCDVRRCADAIAWCTTHFDDAPPVVNLFEPDLSTRGAVLTRLRSLGWRGRMVWVPISFISAAIVAAGAVRSVLSGRLPDRLAAWSVLKPRRYDSRLAAKVLGSCR